MRLLNFWEEKCRRKLFRYAALKNIIRIKIKDQPAAKAPVTLEGLLQYREARDQEYRYYSGYGDSAWESGNDRVYAFITKIATDSINKGRISPEEQNVLFFYAGEYTPLINSLKKHRCGDTPLQKQYNARAESLRYSDAGLVALYAGTWMPDNQLADLGIHPEIGLRLGKYYGKMNYNFSLGGRFIKSPEDYRVLKHDSVYNTHNFAGIYAALEVGRALYKGIKNELDLTVGLGYDAINIVPADQEKGIDGVNIGSLNVNVGFGYLFYFNNKDFIELEARYHFLNYQNHIDNTLYGNATTLRLIFGFTDDNERQATLKAMGY